MSDGGKRRWMMSGLCFRTIEADGVMRGAGFITPASVFGDVFEMLQDRTLEKLLKVRKWEKRSKKLQARTTL